MSLLLSDRMERRRRKLTLEQLEEGEIIRPAFRVRRERSRKWFQLATLVLPNVLERAEERKPLGRSEEIIRAAAEERFDRITEDDVGELLAYLAFLGYVAREVEEEWR